MKKNLCAATFSSLWTVRHLAWVMVAVYTILALRETSFTLAWPYVVDSPLMHYIAWRLMEGDAPYRDIYDMNFPMAYIHHVMAISVFGYSDLGWRVFTLLWSAWMSLGAYLFCRKDSRLAGGIAALLVWFMTYVMGPAHAGQRDLFLCGYILWAAVAAFAYLEHPAQKPPVYYGLLVGVLMALGCWTKPIVGVAALMFGAYFIWRGAYRLLRLYVLGGVAVSVVMVAWLAAHGSLAPLVAMIFGYLIPIYSQYDRAHGWQIYVRSASWVAILVVTFFIPRRPSRRGWFASILCIYGLAHYFLQAKGWGYHAYPLMVFFAVSAGMALAEGLHHKHLCVRILSVLFMWGIFEVYINENTVTAYDYAPEMQMVAQLKTDLPQLKAEGYQSVQIFDTSHGVLHGLLRARVKNMTPFMYDFMLLEPPLNAYTTQMRAEFESRVAADPPDSIILSRGSWPDDNRSYADKLAAYPYLEKLLTDRYNEWTPLGNAREGYAVYVKKKSHL